MRIPKALVILAICLSAAAMAAASAASAAASAAQVSVDMMNLDVRNRQERCEREIMRLSAMAPGPVDRDTLVTMAKEIGCDLSSPGKKETLAFLAILLAGLAGAVAYDRWDDRRRGWKA